MLALEGRTNPHVWRRSISTNASHFLDLYVHIPYYIQANRSERTIYYTLNMTFVITNEFFNMKPAVSEAVLP